MTDMEIPAENRRGIKGPIADHWIVAGVGFAFLAAFLLRGVWEPWEAERAQALHLMREAGTWLSVQMPTSTDPRAIAELPFGYWPSAILGSGVAALRLPGLLSGVAVLVALFLTGRRFFDRWGAVFSALAALCLPLFVFHSGLGLGAGLAMNCLALAVLGLLNRALDDTAGKGWLFVGWGALTMASLSVGVIGLLAPLVAVGAALTAMPSGERMAAVRRAIGPMWLPAAALVLVAAGWGLAVANGPENSTFSMLLWADPLSAAPAVAKRPSFEMFTHQLGFGLYPLIAVVPLAFADLLWSEDVEPRLRALGAALAAFFALTFLAPAWAIPHAGYGVFLGAPVIALVVGGYFWRVLRTGPQPILTLVTVVTLALIDSNLKHETRALADTLVGGTVETFPPKLAHWSIARVLSMGLLGVLLVHQGGIYRMCKPVARLFYPRMPRILNGWAALMALVGPIIPLALSRTAWLQNRMLSPKWGKLVMSMRWLIVLAAAFVVLYIVFSAVIYLRAKLLKGRTDGKVTRGFDELEKLGQDAFIWRIALVSLFVCWAGFFSVVAAKSLSSNFSQKGLLSAYSEFAQNDEPLFKHRLPKRDNSYYARDLENLDRTAFKEKAKESSRFFALVPRKDLASINADFRAATGRTLPVIDDRSYRVLLVSNQIKDGEEDLNPIRRALVKELPPEAKPVSFVFDEKIELIGWSLDPAEPKPGSELKMTMYWRALKKIRGTWKVFVHIDAPGQRIHGDHDPVAGLYPSSNWAEGDIIRDEHTVKVKRSISGANFTFYTGLYRGKTRMKVTKGAKDKDNRARIGRVRVR